MISTIFWKNLLAVQWMSTFFVEFKKVFQEQEQQQTRLKKFSPRPRGKSVIGKIWFEYMIQKVFMKKQFVLKKVFYNLRQKKFDKRQNFYKFSRHIWQKTKAIQYEHSTLMNKLQQFSIHTVNSTKFVDKDWIPLFSWTRCSNFHEFHGQALNSTIFVDTLQ